MDSFNKKKYKSTCNGIGLLIILIILFLNLFAGLLFILTEFFFGANYSDPVLEPLIDIMVSVFGIFITGIAYVKISGKSLNELAPVRKVSIREVLPLTFICLSVSFVSSYMTDILLTNFSFFNIKNNVNFETEIPGAPVFILQVLSVAVIPALIEEFVFRGAILNALRPYGDGQAILISSILFSLLHQNITQIPFTFIIGIALGFIMVKTSSLLPGIIIHFLINLFSVITDALLQSKIPEETVSIIYFSAILLTALTGLLSAALLSRKKKGYFKINSENREKFRQSIKLCFTSAGIIVAVIMMILRTVELISI